MERARSAKQRAAEGLPHASTLMTDDFMALTLDVWSIPPESARRVGHPAPFPVELSAQLISLYTFRDDLVLDPLMGSGSALVAAARLDRRYVGYDLDPAYVEVAQARVATALAEPSIGSDDRTTRAASEGLTARRFAERVLSDAGFTTARRDQRVPGAGISIDNVATDADGAAWYFDVAGPYTSQRGGRLRTETVLRALGRAVAVRAHSVMRRSWSSRPRSPAARPRFPLLLGVDRSCGCREFRSSGTPDAQKRSTTRVTELTLMSRAGCQIAGSCGCSVTPRRCPRSRARDWRR